jgi:hypothetical protein
MHRYLGTALIVLAGAMAAIGAKQVVVRAWAQAPTSRPCQPTAAERCELRGFNLVANPNDPAVYVLQLDTTGGPHAFAADRATLERFAREILDVVEGRGSRRL